MAQGGPVPPQFPPGRPGPPGPPPGPPQGIRGSMPGAPLGGERRNAGDQMREESVEGYTCPPCQPLTQIFINSTGETPPSTVPGQGGNDKTPGEYGRDDDTKGRENDPFSHPYKRGNNPKNQYEVITLPPSVWNKPESNQSSFPQSGPPACHCQGGGPSPKSLCMPKDMMVAMQQMCMLQTVYKVAGTLVRDCSTGGQDRSVPQQGCRHCCCCCHSGQPDDTKGEKEAKKERKRSARSVDSGKTDGEEEEEGKDKKKKGKRKSRESERSEERGKDKRKSRGSERSEDKGKDKRKKSKNKSENEDDAEKDKGKGKDKKKKEKK